MKPAQFSQLRELLEEKPILVLKKAWMGVSYVDALVHRSPANILPYNGKGRSPLPLELWLQIIDLLVRSTPSEAPRNNSCLVQPRHLELTTAGPMLVCVEVTERTKCGDLGNGRAVGVYESYLRDPYHAPRKPDDVRPFTLPAGGNETDAIHVDVVLLDSGIKVLFGQVTVPDVIAQCEQGGCKVCESSYPRWVCPWCEDGRKARSCFLKHRYKFPIESGAHRFLMFCPLCVGMDESEQSLRKYGPEKYVRDNHITDMTGPFDAWSRSVLVDLGYQGSSEKDRKGDLDAISDAVLDASSD